MRMLSWGAGSLGAVLVAVDVLMGGGVPAHARAVELPQSSPRQAATAAAARMLEAFRPPRDAVRIRCPATGMLLAAPERPGAANLVTRTGCWRTAGQPRTVLDWIQAHQMAGFAWSGGGEITVGPQVADFAEFTAGTKATERAAFPAFPAFPALTALTAFPEGRTLLVSVASAAGGTAIRVDAQVTWLPPKPAGERVPAGARVLTVEYLPGSGPVEEITDPAVIRRIAAVVDSLPLAAPGLGAAGLGGAGQVGCPVDFGRRVRLTFRAARGARPLAVLTAQLGGCGIVTMTVGGRAYPALTDASALVDALPGRPFGGGRFVH